MPSHLRVAAVLLFVPMSAAAQAIAVPKALVFPNYDNVLVGKNQALEGGAYIARVNDASANFYNPAGLVAAEKTSLNASSTGYVWSRITSKASGNSISTSKLEGVPGYFGAVIEPPFLDQRNLRLGFSVTRSVSWSPGTIDQSIAPNTSDFDRITFATQATFQTQLYQLAVAWAPTPALRLGVAGGVAQTSFSSNVALSGATSPEGQPGQFLSTLRTNGTDYAVAFALGAQWDLAAGFTVGALVRPPGIRLGGSSLVTQESNFVQASTNASSFVFFRDDTGTFTYKLPLEASAGVAYRHGAVELELDLRYHQGVSQYDLYRSNVPYQVLTQTAGVTSTTTEPPPVVSYAARQVFNVALGGNVRLGRVTTLHAGFYDAMSPVSDVGTAPFRKSDLYGFTAGVDFQFEKFGASLGAGYQFGTSQTVGTDVLGNAVSTSELSLQSISVLYAISYQF